ncbi:hypothetical protein D3C76_554810 [compost metagenome]
MALLHIGMATFDKGLDQRDDLRYVRGDARLKVRGGHPKCGHVRVVSIDEAVSDTGDGNACRRRGGIDLVVYVGKVAGIHQFCVVVAQQPGQQVEHHGRARIANVRIVVDRGAADVHRHLVGP